MITIDLNSDLGESFGPWTMGDDAAMLALVTSANVACGGHASDPETMFATLSEAKARGVTIGAHPGYSDREGFGRRVIPMTEAEIERLMAAQIGALMGVAALVGAQVRYIKPHGALGNLAADNRGVAASVARATRAVSRDLALLAISGSELESAGRGAGLAVYSEVFADRAYLATGRLVPRSRPGAMIEDSGAASDRLLGFLETGLMPTLEGAPIRLEAHSICIHGDSRGAVAMARAIRESLAASDIDFKSFIPSSQ
jgi:5-oxoprolinase (ATP-hydrolysing) subunit A